MMQSMQSDTRMERIFKHHVMWYIASKASLEPDSTELHAHVCHISYCKLALTQNKICKHMMVKRGHSRRTEHMKFKVHRRVVGQ